MKENLKNLWKYLAIAIFAVVLSLVSMVSSCNSNTGWEEEWTDPYIPTLEITKIEMIGENEYEEMEFKVYITNTGEVTCDYLPYMEIVTDDKRYIDAWAYEDVSEGEWEANLCDIPGGESSWAIYAMDVIDYEKFVKGHLCTIEIDEYEAYAEDFTHQF